ncbi:alanine/ornithine racemase family PLP-dependent enzyme [Cellulomonas sp. Leaf334]|uniref:alanine/ornithine racemase family PLP-dependent enzyme n=1 Tax=Cellulomonas sp. Leaf334 TaxID=1736339 RepID=UPI0006F6CCE8|nr:alanine/ornithine racemase family PLP-dependent enzyme [Cellulomonas sp. Leaf334]KQR16790.1 alanine racemase [Cellulomonas sp. Leaf334]
MSAPRIEIDLAAVEHNTRVLVDRLATRDVRVTGVTKATLGSPAVAAAMIRGGVAGLGDSRVENLARLDVPVPRTLIRSPMISQAAQVVRTASASLNTGPTVIAALDDAATQAGLRHDVILMVELGDLREGIAVDDVAAAVQVVLGSRSLRLLGLGANLACQNGVVPDDTNMAVLHRIVEATEARHHLTLDVVSAGNSATLDWALTTTRLGRTNELRLGESILLGTEPLRRTPVAGLSTDAFTLVGEVIEVAEKPARPWGNRAQAAYGEPPVCIGRGTRRQAIVALGRQDVDLDGLIPPAGVTVLGMSSDHLVLDLGDHQVGVGDELRFGLGYGALVRAMTSPFVTRADGAGIPALGPGVTTTRPPAGSLLA